MAVVTVQLRPHDRLQIRGEVVLSVVRCNGQAVRLEIVTGTNTLVQRLGVSEAIESEMDYLRTQDERGGDA